MKLQLGQLGSMMLGVLAIAVTGSACDGPAVPDGATAATSGRVVQPGAAFGERTTTAPAAAEPAPAADDSAGAYEVDIYPNGRQPSVMREVRVSQAPQLQPIEKPAPPIARTRPAAWPATSSIGSSTATR